MKINYTGKNILITGGSSGIGLALAKLFSRKGANIWVVARDEKKLITVSPLINNINEKKYFVADVSVFSDLQLVYDYFASMNLAIDLLINSAGVVQPGEFDQMPLERFHWMMEINYFGTVNCIKQFLPLMKPGAAIVNIASMSAIIGVYGYTAYSASKYAVRGFSDAIRSELKLKGIHLSIVFPPDTQTPQLDYDNFYKPKITKELSSSAGILTADQVAEEIFKGLTRKKYIIIPGLESKILYLTTNFLGRLTYPVMDMTVNSAIKKIKKNK